jgi:hypothetical protein
MLSKKILLLTTAVLALGVAASACSGDDDDDGGSYSLASGDYNLDITDLPVNTCWPAGNPLPLDLTSIALPIEIISTSGNTFQIVMPDAVSAFLPNVEGTINGNDLDASGDVVNYALNTSGCILDIHATAVGELTGDNEFNATVTANLHVESTDTCADLVGESIPGTNDLVPFPTLTNVSNGDCSISLVGDGVLDES